MNQVAPARAAAFDILLSLEERAGHSDELLRSETVDRLSAPDKNLATNLVMGTLRWQTVLDAHIRARLSKPGTAIDAAVRIALRLGIFQLLYLDRVPAYAAIGESVELAKLSGNRFAAGMVNAILRKIAQAPKKETETVTNAAEIAGTLAHPLWLVERWVKRFGLAEATAICRYDQEPPPVFIRLRGTGVEEKLLQDGLELAAGSFLTSARRVTGGDVRTTRAFREGYVSIQDEGSQLVAELAGRGQRILDVCAAPGGKAAILAERNPEADIVACDVSGRRLKEMQALLGKTLPETKIQYVTADAANHAWPSDFDLALCDAPCSGTGTIGRNPEIRHILREDGLNRQQQRQIEILASAMRGMVPGGRLLYATCSLEPEENEDVVHRCLDGNSDFEKLPLDAEVERLAQSGALLPHGVELLRSSALQDGFLRTIPGVHGCDGFFAALLVRKTS